MPSAEDFLLYLVQEEPMLDADDPFMGVLADEAAMNLSGQKLGLPADLNKIFTLRASKKGKDVAEILGTTSKGGRRVSIDEIDPIMGGHMRDFGAKGARGRMGNLGMASLLRQLKKMFPLAEELEMGKRVTGIRAAVEDKKVKGKGVVSEGKILNLKRPKGGIGNVIGGILLLGAIAQALAQVTGREEAPA